MSSAGDLLNGNHLQQRCDERATKPQNTEDVIEKLKEQAEKTPYKMSDSPIKMESRWYFPASMTVSASVDNYPLAILSSQCCETIA